MTHSPSAIRALLAEHGLEASRALGQNFVADANTVRKIVRLAGVRSGDRVVEVGAGLGSLTLALLDAGAEVTAIEVDKHLAPVLRSVVEPGGATVVEADAMVLDWAALLGPEDPARPWALVANLPYNIAAPLVLDLLETAPAIERLVVLVQLEVGERLAAGPGTKTYGIPSVKAAWFADVRRAGAIGRNVFWPAPNVDSGLVAWTGREPPTTAVSREQVFAVVDAAFAQRRKTLRGALSRLAGSPSAAEDALRAAGVDPTARGEVLDVTVYARIAESLSGEAPA